MNLKKIIITDSDKNIFIFVKQDEEVDIFLEQNEVEMTWGIPESYSVSVKDFHNSRTEIMSAIFANSPSQELLGRLLNAIDSKASAILALDNENYDLFRMKMQQCVAEGLMTQDDVDYVNQYIPA